MTQVYSQPQSGFSTSPVTGRQSGFTLIELMTVIAIVGIVAVLATPNMVTVIERNQKSAALNSVFGMLNMARSQAVTRQETVSVCPSSDQATCNTNYWEAGWLMFVDDGTGTGGTADDGNLNGTEELLRIGVPASGSVTVRSHTEFTDLGAVSFDNTGLATSRGTLVICDSTGASSASGAILNLSGQPRLAVDTSGNGTVEGSAGITDSDDVTCP